MPNELLIQMAALVGGMGATYAAIRADLAAIRVNAEMAVQGVESAHKRIDDHIDKHHVRS